MQHTEKTGGGGEKKFMVPSQYISMPGATAHVFKHYKESSLGSETCGNGYPTSDFLLCSYEINCNTECFM